jgi:hypothetical protein
VRRTLAGLLFGIAYLSASLAVSGWLLQRTAFDPGRTAASADVVLADSAIKNELVDLIADATAAQLGLQQGETRALVRSVVDTEPGAKLMGEILHDAHAHLIGAQREPVQITAAQMVEITRNEAVGELPPITLPVPKVTVLDIMRRVLAWLVPIAALVALVFAVVGMMAHPERAALLRSLGLGLLLLAALVALLGYVVPRFVLPLLSDSPWAHVPRRLADDSLTLIIAVELLLVGAAVALLAGSGAMRRQRRWSTPVSTYRYNEERRWS